MKRSAPCRRAPVLKLAVVTALCAGATSCMARGPGRVQATRPSYNTVLQQTNSEQLLLNLVRLRYGDPIQFLDVSSVTTSFEFAGSLGGEATFPSGSATGAISYKETPTIIYSPLQGEQFVRQIVSPISLPTISLLTHSGVALSRVLRIVLHSLNDLTNLPEDVLDTHEGFLEAVEVLERVRRNRGLQLERVKDSEEVQIQFSADGPSAVAVQHLKQLLGLSADQNLFPVVATNISAGPNTIRFSTRSMLSVLSFLAESIELPPEDEVRSRRGKVLEEAEAGARGKLLSGLMRIGTSPARPQDAAIAVRYRGHWFYIDDRDPDSKTTFQFLSLLLALQAGETRALSPVLTVPTR